MSVTVRATSASDERAAVEPLGRREQAATRDDVRVAGAARDVGQGDVRPGPRPDRDRRPGRDELDGAADLLARLGQPRPDEPVAGGDPAERGRDEALRAARLEEEDGSAVAREERRGGVERAPDRRRLPAPRRTPGAAEDRLEREQRRRVAAEDPAGREVGVRQPLDVRALGRLAEDEPDPRPVRQPGQRVGLGLERPERRRRPEPDDDVGHPLGQALEVLAEAGGHQPERGALEALDEAADDAEAVLEREPRVALAPLAAGRQADPAAADPQVGDPARVAVEPRGRQQGVEERQAHRGLDRGRAQVALDPLEDRLEPDELARRVEVEQLLDERVVAVDGREPVADRRARPGRAGRSPRSGRGRPRRSSRGAGRRRRPGRGRPCSGSACGPAAGRRPGRLSQTISSRTTLRPHVAQRLAYFSPSQTLSADCSRGAAAIAWKAASRWRTSGGRRTTSASSRVSGLVSSEAARRWRSTAARAIQPPRPWRSTTTSPRLECASIRAATSSGGGGGARRPNAGSEKPGSLRIGTSRPAMGGILPQTGRSGE